MMYGYGSMMGGGSVFMSLVGIIIFIDLILLGLWLWKKINAKEGGE